MEIAGYIASIFIGISLGLIGGGGSILTVPVLVYLFGEDAVTATAYSLFIVGVASAVGSVQYFRRSLVNVKTAIVFGIPSVVAVFLTRAYIIPAIPETVYTIGDFDLSKRLVILAIFALLMIVASIKMIMPSRTPAVDTESRQQQKFDYPLILAEGLVVGMLTGLVGAGGGFLIIPALVILSKLPMKEAVGTSLLIIAAKSLLGLLGESSETQFHWPVLLLITAFAVAGIFIGNMISKKVNGDKLKPAFGWFVLVMGGYILLRETVFMQ
ncbi:MAG: sulfite exporter TauE/SafE family protein [Salibacteraceae bacterium]